MAANIVGVLWVAAALVTLSYFAVRDIQIVPALSQGMRAEPGPVKHLVPPRRAVPGRLGRSSFPGGDKGFFARGPPIFSPRRRPPGHAPSLL